MQNRKNEIRNIMRKLENKVKSQKAQIYHLAYLSQKRGESSVSQRQRVLELDKVLGFINNEYRRTFLVAK